MTRIFRCNRELDHLHRNRVARIRREKRRLRIIVWISIIVMILTGITGAMFGLRF